MQEYCKKRKIPERRVSARQWACHIIYRLWVYRPSANAPEFWILFIALGRRAPVSTSVIFNAHAPHARTAKP